MMPIAFTEINTIGRPSGPDPPNPLKKGGPEVEWVWLLNWNARSNVKQLIFNPILVPPFQGG